MPVIFDLDIRAAHSSGVGRRGINVCRNIRRRSPATGRLKGPVPVALTANVAFMPAPQHLVVFDGPIVTVTERWNRTRPVRSREARQIPFPTYCVNSARKYCAVTGVMFVGHEREIGGIHKIIRVIGHDECV